MKNRTELAKHFKERGYKVGAEIGVADGRYAEILCRENPELHLYCVDLWKPYESSWRTQESQDKAYEEAESKLDNFNTTIIKKSSIEASLDIPDESLDFVFIDGDHTFDHAMTDIIIWARKVRKGGIVSGHDYCHFTESGVVEAVNKYTEIHRIELKLTPRNKNVHRDDRQPCWWFYK